MELLTFEAIKASSKTEPQTFSSSLWGGNLQFRYASVGDKIDAKMKAKTLQELMNAREITLELCEAGAVMTCVESPRLSAPQMVEIMNQPGSAAEISALSDQILKRVTGNPTK